MKLAVGHFTGSISVLADGANSAGDVVTSLIAWSAVRKANQPADDEHRYGHGKYESLAAAFESLVIIAAALAISWGALLRLLSGAPPQFEKGVALAVMALSALANLAIAVYLERQGRRHDSLALKAEAAHHRVDIWTSSGVLAGLVLISVSGWDFVDPLLAIVIGLVILFQGAQVGREAFHQLLDRSLPPEEMAGIRHLLAEHDDLFLDYHRLRARKAGRERQVDLHLVTCPRVTVQEAHEVCDHLEQDIRKRFPLTRVVIHVEPCNETTCPNRSAGERNPDTCQLSKRDQPSASPETAKPVPALPEPMK